MIASVQLATRQLVTATLRRTLVITVKAQSPSGARVGMTLGHRGRLIREDYYE